MVYLADGASQHRIVEVNPDGSIAGSFGSYGSQPGHFERPGQLAVTAQGNILVSDQQTAPQEVTPLGAPVRTFGTMPSQGIATDGTNIYVLGSGCVLLSYDSAGGPLGTYNLANTSGQCLGLAYDPSSHDLWLADQTLGQLTMFTPTGAYVGAVTGLTMPNSVAVDPSGDVFTTDREGQIQGFAPDHHRLATYGGIGASVGSPTQFAAVTYSESAVYAASAIIGDSGAYRIDTVAPIPSISSPNLNPRTSQTVTFDASKSFLPFGQITAYQWDLDGSGRFATSTGSTPTASRMFTTPGTNTVSVRVTGSSGQTATANLTVTTTSSHATIRAPSLVAAGAPARFDASGSALPASTISDYEWDFRGNGDFSVDTGATGEVTHTFSTPGVGRIGVRVTRSGGVVDTTYATVRVIPVPPAGNLGFSISNGDYATNNLHVSLYLGWPQGATQALISNDGGFNTAGPQSDDLAVVLPWTLPRTGKDRLPKTAYVRFLGAGIDYVTFTDDIVLDETAPTLASASLVGASGAAAASVARAKANRKPLHRYRIRLKAIDATAGICGVDASSARRGGTTTIISNCRKKGIVRLVRIVAVRAIARPRYVRVLNSAGSWSRWLSVR